MEITGTVFNDSTATKTSGLVLTDMASVFVALKPRKVLFVLFFQLPAHTINTWSSVLFMHGCLTHSGSLISIKCVCVCACVCVHLHQLCQFSDEKSAPSAVLSLCTEERERAPHCRRPSLPAPASGISPGSVRQSRPINKQHIWFSMWNTLSQAPPNEKKGTR